MDKFQQALDREIARAKHEGNPKALKALIQTAQARGLNYRKAEKALSQILQEQRRKMRGNPDINFWNIFR